MSSARHQHRSVTFEGHVSFRSLFLILNRSFLDCLTAFDQTSRLYFGLDCRNIAKKSLYSAHLCFKSCSIVFTKHTRKTRHLTALRRLDIDNSESLDRNIGLSHRYRYFNVYIYDLSQARCTTVSANADKRLYERSPKFHRSTGIVTTD